MNFSKKYVVQWLGRYIKDFRTDQVESHLFKGEIVLSNLEIDCETLLQDFLWRYLPFTVELRSLTASLVRINIPWHNLYGEPVTVKLGDLNVEVLLHRNNDTTRAAEMTQRQRDHLMNDLIATANDNVRPSEAERQKKLFHDLKLSMTRIIIDGLQVVVTDVKVRVFSRCDVHFEPTNQSDSDTPRPAYTITLDTVEYYPVGKGEPDLVRSVDEQNSTAEMDREIKINGIRCFLPTQDPPVLFSTSELTVRLHHLLWTHTGGRYRMTPFPMESLMDIDLGAIEITASNEQVSCVLFLLLDLCVSVLVPPNALANSDSHLHWVNTTATERRPSALFQTSWGSGVRGSQDAESFQSLESPSESEAPSEVAFGPPVEEVPAVADSSPVENPDKSVDNPDKSVDNPDKPVENPVDQPVNDVALDKPVKNRVTPGMPRVLELASPLSPLSPSEPDSSRVEPYDAQKAGKKRVTPLQKRVQHAFKSAVTDTGNLANKTGNMVVGTKHLLFGSTKRRSKGRRPYIGENEVGSSLPSWDSSSSSSAVPSPPLTQREPLKVEEWTLPEFADEDPDLEYRDLIVTQYGLVTDKMHLRIGSLKVQSRGLLVEIRGLDFSSNNIGRLTSFEKEQLAVLGYTVSDGSPARNIPEDPRLRHSATCFLTITSLRAVAENPVIDVQFDALKALTLKWRSPGPVEDPAPDSCSWNPMEGCLHNITVVTDPAEGWEKVQAFFAVGISPVVTDFTSGNGPARWQRILLKDTMVKLGGGKKVMVPDITISNAEDLGQLVCTLQCLPSVPQEFHDLDSKVRTRLSSKKSLCICTRDVSLLQRDSRPLSIGSSFGERQFRVALASSSSRVHKNMYAPVFNQNDDGPNGLYIPVSEYRELRRVKEDHERMQISERIAKQQLALAVERMAELQGARTVEELQMSGLNKKDQLNVAREKMVAMDIELQTVQQRLTLKDATKEEQLKTLRKQVVDADVSSSVMRTLFEEQLEELRHTQQGQLHIIDRQKKALDSMMAKRRLGKKSLDSHDKRRLSR